MKTRRPPRLIVAILVAGFSTGLHAEAPAVDPSIGRVEVVAQLPREAPYVGEPILLKIRSSVRANLALDKMIQPALSDFDWQQFGIDTSNEEMIDGFWTPVIERVLMVIPLKAGALTIPPFVRRVKIVTGGEWVEADFASRPLAIDIRAREGIGDADDWWLPAKSVQITDSWEPAPDKIPFGETARRTLTIEAAGITADRLSPAPVLRAPGLITFPGPVDRQTIVTDEGPIARAVYRWNVRPISMTPASVPAIHIPWFDIATRKMRDAGTLEREVAFLDISRKVKPPTAMTKDKGMSSVWPLTAGVASFAWTMAIVYLISSSKFDHLRLRTLFEPKPKALRDLKRAARQDDTHAFRRAGTDLSRLDQDRWRRVLVVNGIKESLASVDAAIFASSSSGNSPVLAPLAAAIATAWKASAARPRSNARNTR